MRLYVFPQKTNSNRIEISITKFGTYDDVALILGPKGRKFKKEEWKPTVFVSAVSE